MLQIAYCFITFIQIIFVCVVKMLELHIGAVMGTVALQNEGHGLDWGPFQFRVCTLHSWPTMVLLRFLPQVEDINWSGVTGHSKLSVTVWMVISSSTWSCEWQTGHMSRGLPRPSPADTWDVHQYPPDPERQSSKGGKWTCGRWHFSEDEKCSFFILPQDVTVG